MDEPPHAHQADDLTREPTGIAAEAPWRLKGWPAPCAVCSTWTREGLCQPCRTRFAGWKARCTTCGRPGVLRCGACLQHPTPQVACVVALDYQFPIDQLISRLKFQQAPEWAPLLGALLAQAVVRSGTHPPPDIVTAVPLSAQRLAQRGYNQSWLLAREVARRVGRPALPHLLQRWRHLDPLSGGANRQERGDLLQGAFLPTPAQRHTLTGRSVALVDDVMTTGATTRAAATALLEGGASQVHLWVLARTPAPDELP